MIKAKPEDFIVEEQADLPLRREGEYRVYILRKSGWNTLDLLHHLSRRFGLPPGHLSYGGKKDKHGLTSQFIAIRDARDLGAKGRDFSLQSRGFMDHPMSPRLVRGNAFQITIRDLRDTTALETNLAEVKKTGFPNFFDDQRFRSYDPERGFFAERILKRHWNGALQVFLTSAGSEDSRSERQRKAVLFKNWKDWPLLLTLAAGPLEAEIFGWLDRHPRRPAPALQRIPDEEVSIRYASYQSHLWNELLRRLIQLKIGNTEEVPGREGGYFFWKDLSPGSLGYFSSLEVPTAAAKMRFSDELTRSVFGAILSEKGLTLGAFRTKALHRVYFRSFQRKALIIPEDVEVFGAGTDELHPGKRRWKVGFTLPRGSYGTMLVKRLVLKPDSG